MKEETKSKFRSVVDYYSDHEPTKRGLYELVLNTDIEIEPTGVIRMTIQIVQKEFLEPNEKPKVYYKRQTVFELENGNYLSDDELLDMFLFTETQFMKTQLKDENGEVRSIKTLHPALTGLDKNRLKEIVRGGQDYISSLW